MRFSVWPSALSSIQAWSHQLWQNAFLSLVYSVLRIGKSRSEPNLVNTVIEVVCGLFVAKKSRISIDVWAGALSWWWQTSLPHVSFPKHSIKLNGMSRLICQHPATSLVFIRRFSRKFFFTVSMCSSFVDVVAPPGRSMSSTFLGLL